VQRPAGVLASGLLRFGLGVHAPPASHDALDVLGGAGAAHGEQPLLGLGCGHAGQLADLGVGEFGAGERPRQERQGGEDAGDADVLSGSAGSEADAPGEPGGAGAEAVCPAAASIELSDEIEKASGGGIEMRRQLGDLVANPIEASGGSVGCADIHGESPFCWGDTTRESRGHLGDATRRDRGGDPRFSRRGIRSGGHASPRSAGVGTTPRRRLGAVARSQICQA
jgi:hypothetical protein